MTRHIALAALFLAGALPMARAADTGSAGMPTAGGAASDIYRPAGDPAPADASSGTAAGMAGRIGQDPVPPMFRELDQDKDGQISRDEAKRSADTTARFEEIDVDHDGRISAAEWIRAEERRNR